MNVIKFRDAIETHWAATGSLRSLRYVFFSSKSKELQNQLITLLSGSTITVPGIREDVDYSELAKGSPWTVWNLLFHAGYCTAVPNDSGGISLIIPNEEVRQSFRNEIDKWEDELLHNCRSVTSLLDSALSGKINEFKKRFINAIESIVSTYDIAGRDEQTYHMLCLGFFIAGTRHGYQIHSNKEAGHGRYDISHYILFFQL